MNLLLAFVATAIPLQTSALPPELAPAVTEVKAALSARSTTPMENHARFMTAWNRLEASVSPSFERKLRMAEGSDFDSKLALIALDRRQRRSHYDTLQARFWTGDPLPSSFRASGTRPRPVPAELMTEANRLVWEYLLMRPGPDALESRERNVADALSHIASPKTLPLLEAVVLSRLSASSRLRTVQFVAIPLSLLTESESPRAARAALAAYDVAQRKRASSVTAEALAREFRFALCGGYPTDAATTRVDAWLESARRWASAGRDQSSLAALLNPAAARE